MGIPSFKYLKKLANNNDEFTNLKKVKLAVLSDSSSQFLHIAIKGYGRSKGIEYDIYESEYNQIDQEIFDDNSALYKFKPEYIFIIRSSEHLLKEFYKKPQTALHFHEKEKEKLNSYIKRINSLLKTNIITNTFIEINDNLFGHFGCKTDVSFIYHLRKTNLFLMDLSRETKNLHICDLASSGNSVGYTHLFDPKLYINADLTFNLEFIPIIAKDLTDIILSKSGIFNKCIILDLDNTLWGGIIGDDGIEGIQIGDYGTGKAYTELQLWVKQLKKRGIILAVCSKNTESIAKEPFEKHPDMVLRLEDIAVFVANWENKADNIRYIQSILNIGFDAMVFIDDNPFEREIVKKNVPLITVPDMPEDCAEYLPYLKSLNLFETSSFTEEDELRTNQYREEAQRNTLLESFTNIEEFLQSLEMKAVVKAFDKFTTPRIAQLSQRSNQFNLRTVRYTEEDIEHIASNDMYITMSFNLEDKFGNHGLICAFILEKISDSEIFINTWIMSCRVLNRGMEQFTLNRMVEIVKNRGYKKIIGEYIPTSKNAIVKDHYSRLGFTEEKGKWVLEVEKFKSIETKIKEQV